MTARKALCFREPPLALRLDIGFCFLSRQRGGHHSGDGGGDGDARVPQRWAAATRKQPSTRNEGVSTAAPRKPCQAPARLWPPRAAQAVRTRLHRLVFSFGDGRSNVCRPFVRVGPTASRALSSRTQPVPHTRSRRDRLPARVPGDFLNAEDATKRHRDAVTTAARNTALNRARGEHVTVRLDQEGRVRPLRPRGRGTGAAAGGRRGASACEPRGEAGQLDAAEPAKPPWAHTGCRFMSVPRLTANRLLWTAAGLSFCPSPRKSGCEQPEGLRSSLALLRLQTWLSPMLVKNVTARPLGGPVG